MKCLVYFTECELQKDDAQRLTGELKTKEFGKFHEILHIAHDVCWDHII